MRTAKQIAASRANGQKSRGPRSAAGKAASRFNALKHGIFAVSQLMFDETAEDFAALAAEYHERHTPSNPEEHLLVETLIANEWRLRRMRRIESHLWENANDTCRVHKLVNDLAIPEYCSSGECFLTDSSNFERLQRVVNSCERSYRLAWKDLVTRASLQAAPAPPADVQLTSQPEEATTTSESPGSFHTNSQSALNSPPVFHPKTNITGPGPPPAKSKSPLPTYLALKSTPQGTGEETA
jgi:hypothetical protein